MKVGLPVVLKYLRNDLNLTQKQLAKETGLSLSAIVSYENGLREPNSRAMATLERYFGVSGEYLRGELDHALFHDRQEGIEKALDISVALFLSYRESFSYASQDRQKIASGILNETLQFLTKTVLRDDNAIPLTSDQFGKLLAYLGCLNPSGQSELVKRADELTQIKAYTVNV